MMDRGDGSRSAALVEDRQDCLLREDARPALLLDTPEERLRALFPVDLTPLPPEAEPEPSKGALVRLESGHTVVVVYGTVTRRATLSFPVSADVHEAIEALLREVPIERREMLWTAEADVARRAGVR